ncbi:fimbrial protein [Hafnia paralvei]|uniref:fimbrial protein n=1 Tax=Hafnia paralvei TaxID=546367 RepID=UPI0026DC3373|nr:fimbrial protein [Hafnia paralvei]MDX6910583.1 fimbrial protein [Hafnia paralvei]
MPPISQVKKTQYRYFYFLLLFFPALFFSHCAEAFHCYTTSGTNIPVGGGTATVSVSISPTMQSGKNLILDLHSGANKIVCASDGAGSSMQDTLNITSPKGITSMDELMDIGGATVRGTDYPLNKTAGLYVLKVYSDSTPTYTAMPIQLYFVISDNPSKSVVVHTGDVLFTLNLTQTNNLGQSIPFVWRFKAANNSYIITTTCTINNNQQIDVPFGTITSDTLTTDPLAATIKKEIALNYYCDSPVTQDIDIMLVATPVSGFDAANVFKTSNTNLGVVMLNNNVEVPPNGVFHTKLINGLGQDKITFVPVIKSSSIKSSDIEGEFTASATLVMSTD